MHSHLHMLFLPLEILQVLQHLRHSLSLFYPQHLLSHRMITLISILQIHKLSTLTKHQLAMPPRVRHQQCDRTANDIGGLVVALA
jgi:hypothetical protein